MLKYKKKSDSILSVNDIASAIGSNRFIFDKIRQEFYEIRGGEKYYPHDNADYHNCLNSKINIADPVQCIQYITGCIINGRFDDGICLDIFKKNALYGLSVDDMRKALNPNTALRILNAFEFKKALKEQTLCYESAYIWLKRKKTDSEKNDGDDVDKQYSYKTFASNASFMQYLQNLVEYVNFYKLAKRPGQIGGKNTDGSLFSKELSILEYNIQCGINGPVSKIPITVGYVESSGQYGGKPITHQEQSSEFIKAFLDGAIRKLRSKNKNLTNETYSNIYDKLSELKSLENEIWNIIQKIQSTSRLIEKNPYVHTYPNEMTLHDLEKLNAEYADLLQTQRFNQSTLVKVISGMESLGMNALVY